MIYYDPDDWVNQVCRFEGTVWARGLWWKVLLISVYSSLAYYYCHEHQINLGTTRRNALGATLSFFLVFRANNAYSRYTQGRTVLTHFFCDLRELVSSGIIHMPGGMGGHRWRWRRHLQQSEQDAEDHDRDDFDKIVSEERTHMGRWALVLAIVFQMYVRLLDEPIISGVLSARTKWMVDWDRYRVRHLMTADEFRKIDAYTRRLHEGDPDIWNDLPFHDLHEGATMFDNEPPSTSENHTLTTIPVLRVVVMVVYKQIEILFSNMNDIQFQNRRYGISERFLPSFGIACLRLLESIQVASQCISTPLPYPYFHLCKTLLFLYIICFPFFIDQELGWYANVCEYSCLALALLGVDAIATELENPFGDDPNDLDFLEKISCLEHEIMYLFKLCNDKASEQNFVWQKMPEVIARNSVVPIPDFLALRTQVDSGGELGSAIYGGEVSREGYSCFNVASERGETASDASDGS